MNWTADDPWVRYIWRTCQPWQQHPQNWPSLILKTGLACAIVDTPEIDEGYRYMGEEFASYRRHGEHDYRWTCHRYINEGYACRWYPGSRPETIDLSQTGQPLTDEQRHRWTREILDHAVDMYVQRVKDEWATVQSVDDMIAFFKKHPHGIHTMYYSFSCNPKTGIEIDLRLIDGGNIGTVSWNDAWAIWTEQPVQNSLF